MLSKKVLSTVLAASLVVSTSISILAADTAATTTTTPATTTTTAATATTTTTTTTTAATPAATTAVAPFKFSDVKDDATFAKEVYKLVKLGILSGKGDNTFGSDDNLTRAEAAKVLVKALGLDAVTGTKSPIAFADIDSSKWYAKEKLAEKAAGAGLIKGFTDKGKLVFAPEAQVTNGQFITMVVRALGYTEDDLVGDTWPFNYIAKATELGLLDKVGDIDVDAPMKRSDMALVSEKMLFTRVKDVWSARETGTNKNILMDVVYKRLKLQKLFTSGNYGIALATKAEDSTVADGKVKILTDLASGDTKDFDISDTDAKSFIGKAVKGFATADNKILWIEDYDTASETKSGKYHFTYQAKTADPTQLVVTDNQVDGKSINVDNQSLLTGANKRFNYVYFNGSKQDPSKFIIPDGSTIKVFDSFSTSHANPSYDIAYATKADQYSYIVDSVDTKNKLIKTLPVRAGWMKDSAKADDPNLPAAFAPLYIPYVDAATVTGDAKSIADIKKYDVVSFTEDVEDDDIMAKFPTVQTIKVTRKTVVGKVTAINPNDWPDWVTVNGTKYDISNMDEVETYRHIDRNDPNMWTGGNENWLGKVDAKYQIKHNYNFTKDLTFILNADGKVVHVYDANPTTAGITDNVSTSLLMFESMYQTGSNYNYTFINGKGQEITYIGTSSSAPLALAQGTMYNVVLDNGKLSSVSTSNATGDYLYLLSGGNFVKSTAPTDVAKNGNFDPKMVDDNAVILVKSSTNSGSVYDKYTGTSFKAKFSFYNPNTTANIVKPQAYMTGNAYSNGLVPVVFAVFDNTSGNALATAPVTQSNASSHVVIQSKGDGQKVSDALYANLKAYINGVLTNVSIANDGVYSGLYNNLPGAGSPSDDKDKGNDYGDYSVINNVYYDSTDKTKITGFTVETLKTGVVNGISTTMVTINGSTYSFADGAKIYVLGSDKKPVLKTATDVTKDMKIEYILNASNQVECAIAAKTVKVTFNVQIPSTVTLDSDLYVTGPFANNFGVVGSYKLSKSGDIYTGTFELLCGTDYKFRTEKGMWEKVDPKDPFANRKLTLESDGAVIITTQW